MLMFWGTLAALNLVAGAVTSSRPNRLYDLDTMMEWGRYWLVEGANIYTLGPWGNVDYPPNAIVLLSPLSLLSLGVAHPVWMLLNTFLVLITPYHAARFLRPNAPFRVIALPILMFLSWGGARTLTQFTLAALACSMLAMVAATTRPVAGGMWLGLAMMKPQVAVPVLLWCAFTRRWTAVLTSMAVVAALVGVFCLRSGGEPYSMTVHYLQTLADYHTGDAILAGMSELRPLIYQIVADVSKADVIAGSIAVSLIGAICVAGFQEGAARRRVLYAAPALVACWSLMTVYHLTYGFVILLPVMMLLALNDAEHSRLRRTLFWSLQVGMMFDIPNLTRQAGLADTLLYRDVLVHVDRALMVVLFAGLITLAWREPAES